MVEADGLPCVEVGDVKVYHFFRGGGIVFSPQAYAVACLSEVFIALLIVGVHCHIGVKACAGTALEEHAVKLVFGLHCNKRLVTKVAHSEIMSDERRVGSSFEA